MIGVYERRNMEPLDYTPLSKEQRLARHIKITIVDRETDVKCTKTLGELYYPDPVPQKQAEKWLSNLDSKALHEVELMESAQSIFPIF